MRVHTPEHSHVLPKRLPRDASDADRLTADGAVVALELMVAAGTAVRSRFLNGILTGSLLPGAEAAVSLFEAYWERSDC